MSDKANQLEKEVTTLKQRNQDLEERLSKFMDEEVTADKILE